MWVHGLDYVAKARPNTVTADVNWFFVVYIEGKFHVQNYFNFQALAISKSFACMPFPWAIQCDELMLYPSSLFIIHRVHCRYCERMVDIGIELHDSFKCNDTITDIHPSLLFENSFIEQTWLRTWNEWKATAKKKHQPDALRSKCKRTPTII